MAFAFAATPVITFYCCAKNILTQPLLDSLGQIDY